MILSVCSEHHSGEKEAKIELARIKGGGIKDSYTTSTLFIISYVHGNESNLWW